MRFSLFDGSVFLNEGILMPSSDAVETVWNASGNPNQWIKNVASSMTNVIRSTV